MTGPRRILLALLGVALLAASARAGEVTVAEDRSLTAEQYVAKGLPSPEREWSGRNLAVAAEVLRAIAAKDPRELPRAGSKTSGSVFARLVSDENLRMLGSASLPIATRLEAVLELMGAQKSLLLVYAEPSNRGPTFDAELVDIFVAMARTMGTLLPMLDEFTATLPADDPKADVRREGLSKVKSGLAQMLDGALMTLTERARYRVSELCRFTHELAKQVPVILPRLTPLTQKEMLARIEKLTEDEKDLDMRKALVELQTAARLALEQ